MTITIPMWLLYVVGGIVAIVLLFCSYVGIIFLWGFYDPFKKKQKMSKDKAIVHINNVSKMIGSKRIKLSEGMAIHIQNELVLALKELEIKV